jgi:hypothetical protein
MSTKNPKNQYHRQSAIATLSSLQGMLVGGHSAEYVPYPAHTPLTAPPHPPAGCWALRAARWALSLSLSLSGLAGPQLPLPTPTPNAVSRLETGRQLPVFSFRRGSPCPCICYIWCTYLPSYYHHRPFLIFVGFGFQYAFGRYSVSIRGVQRTTFCCCYKKCMSKTLQKTTSKAPIPFFSRFCFITFYVVFRRGESENTIKNIETNI